MSVPYEGDSATILQAGIYGANSVGGDGVLGTSATGNGVRGQNGPGADPSSGGVVPPNGAGVFGESDQFEGVFGASTSGPGVHGINGAPGIALQPKESCGVWGESVNGYGVYGASKTSIGVYARGEAGHNAGEFDGNVHVTENVHVSGSITADLGVKATSDGNAPGVIAKGSGNQPAVSATVSEAGDCVIGVNALGASGVRGISGTPGNAPAPKNACGVWGESANGYGVYGASQNSSGVYGAGTKGHYAGEFDGDVHVTGDLHVEGDVFLPGADCAEQFDTAGDDLDPGTVVVIDAEGALRKSMSAYDRKVAGVVSGAGGYTPGIVLDRQASQKGRASVALIGKVYCRVDAQYSPIEVGDLLTTSPTPGHAMRAGDPGKSFGAVIGKALGPLRQGQGLIPVLVALQ